MLLLLLIILTLLCFWIAYVDWVTFRIPNIANLLVMIFGLFFVYASDSSMIGWAMLETAVVFGVLFGFSYVAIQVRQETSFGMGDVKFVTASTPWIGAIQVPWMLVLACTLALSCAIVFAYTKNIEIRKIKIAFGPYLSLSILMFSWSNWAINYEILTSR